MSLLVVFVAGIGARADAQGGSMPHPAREFRLAIRPRQYLAELSRSKEREGRPSSKPGILVLDSIPQAWVYVPRRCVPGQPPCPLVVYIDPEEGAGQIRDADRYGMLLLGISGGGHELDRALAQILRMFPVDPAKIAVEGFSASGELAFELGRANPGIFSRVMVLSAPLLGYAQGKETGAGPQVEGQDSLVPAQAMLLSEGIDEQAMANSPLTLLQAARRLNQGGVPVTMLLDFRDHEETLDAEQDFLWNWLQESWAIRPATLLTQRAVSISAMPVLTVEALTQLADFWHRFMQEPESIRRDARLNHVRAVQVSIGHLRPSVLMMDMPALALVYPSVAEDLKAAGLTAKRADAYLTALVVARCGADALVKDSFLASHHGAAARFMQSIWGDLSPTSVAGRNIAFLRVHEAARFRFAQPPGDARETALAALDAMGVWQWMLH